MSHESFRVFLDNSRWYIDRDKIGYFMVIDTPSNYHISRFEDVYPNPCQIQLALKTAWKNSLNTICRIKI